MSATVLRTFSPTCPHWCASEHAPAVVEDGHVTHTRTVRTGDSAVDIEQTIEWSEDPSGQLLTITYPPAAVLGGQFIPGEAVTFAQLRDLSLVLDRARRELYDLVTEFSADESNSREVTS